jgi:hypothetical protein
VLPLKSTMASIVDAVTGTVDALTNAPVTALTAIASAVPPQPPQPEPRDYIAITTCDGEIEDVSEPNTQYNLYVYRNKVISESDGVRSVTIVKA